MSLDLGLHVGILGRDTRPDSHVLYRFFDAAGQLIYLGVTSRPRHRFDQHQGTAP